MDLAYLSDALWDKLWIFVIMISFVISILMFKNKKILLEDNQKEKQEEKTDLKVFLASLAGSLGLGNIIWVTSALIFGGPSVIIWLWLGVFTGRFIKTAEIFCSLQYPEMLHGEKFCGALTYAKYAFPKGLGKILSILISIVFLIYSVEIYQFSCTVSIISNFLWSLMGTMVNFPYGFLLCKITIGCLLILLLSYQDKNKFLNIMSGSMIVFMVLYIIFFLFMSAKYITRYAEILPNILQSSFSNKIWPIHMGLSKGISSAIYSGDVGVTYEGVIQKYNNQKKGFFKTALHMSQGSFIDAIVCTMTLILVLIFYGTFGINYGLDNELILITNVFKSVPLGHGIFVVLCFLAGFSTVSAYAHVGTINIRYLYRSFTKESNIKTIETQEKKAVSTYLILGSFLLFASIFYDPVTIRNIMSISSGLLVMVNCIILLKLFFIINKNKKL